MNPLREKYQKKLAQRQEFIDMIKHHTCKQWVKEQIANYDRMLMKLRKRVEEYEKSSGK